MVTKKCFFSFVPEAAKQQSTPKAERGKRSLGAVYTPTDIADFMVSLATPPPGQVWSVLEPACADAPFLQAWQRRYGTHHRLTGVEIDTGSDKAFAVQNAQHIHTDFLLWQTDERFDVIIGNPPYGIIGDASHYPIHALVGVKEHYKRTFQTWHGKYNIYGAFIERSVNLLTDHGHLVFVVPTTWLVLDDFAPLRRFLAQRGSLHVYYLGKAFAGITVTAVVLHFTKGGENGTLALYDSDQTLAHKDPHYTGDLICFHTPETRAFEAQFDTTVGDLFEIRFAARSPEFKKSPYVSEIQTPQSLPVLTGRNLKSGYIDYQTNHSGLWIRPQHVGQLRPFYTTPHIVVAHTKGAKVVAAVDDRCFAWREEFHLVPRYEVDPQTVTNFLNSVEVQMYVHTLYRDMTPHLTRTQLARVPLPTLKRTTNVPRPKLKHTEQLSLVLEKPFSYQAVTD